MKLRWNVLVSLCLIPVGLLAESEPVETNLAGQAPYVYAGRLFASTSANGSKLSGTGTAVGPGVVLTAAHVYWTSNHVDDENDPSMTNPWLAFRQWYPGANSDSSESFENVISVVSLTGYDDMLHTYDESPNDNTSPFEAFNRDSLVLRFASDDATPHGILRYHPQAAESGFLGQRNFYEVVGYPTAKYFGSDSRKWKVHRTTERDSITVSRIPSLVYDGGYTYENRLFTGGAPLDSYAGNSGGPVIARANEPAEWLLVGVYVGSNALFRGVDAELSSLIDTTISLQNQDNSPRFRFAGDAFTLSEGGDPIQIGVERLGDSAGAAIASIRLVDLTPGGDDDFSHSFALEWADGESGLKNMTVSAPEDQLREGDESHLILLNTSINTLDTQNVVLVTVEDNDLNQPLDQWTIIDEVGAVDYSEVTFAEGKFVSVGGANAIYWTPDYQEVGIKEFPNLNRLYQLTHAAGLFVGCGDGPQLIVSEDGIDWDVVELPTSISVFSTQFGHGLFVGVGGIDAGAASQGEVWVSEDARNWEKVYDERHERFDDIEFGNGIFLARAGSDIYRSDDGRTWARLETNGLGGEPSDMEFGAGRFIMAGRLGGIYFSSDGVAWTLVRQEDEDAWYGVGYRNGYFVATGNSGKLATSEDGGLTWVDRYPPTPESLWHGVTALGKMVVIGDNGLLMESQLPEYFDFSFQPESQVAEIGSSVGFSAEFASSDSAPVTYQWRKDGVDLPGENLNALNLSDLALSDSGEYQLAVRLNDIEYLSDIAYLMVPLRVFPPENFSASTTTSRGMMLNWDDISSGEIGYLIQRRMIGETLWETVVQLEANSTQYLDRFLKPETGYEYQIQTITEGELLEAVSASASTQVSTNFANLSTRGLVGSEDEVMIGGFTIPSGTSMTLYIRGLGPSLQGSGIVNTIDNPQLRLVNAPVNPTVEITNDDWMDADNLDQILASGLPPTNEKESALWVTLPPGAYTVILSSEARTEPAVGMIEIFDATEGCDSCRLVNLSTRGLVGSGNDLMIGGLFIRGPAEKGVFVRALGPSLPEVLNRLPDPRLRMVSWDGTDLSIDSWTESPSAGYISTFPIHSSNELEPAELFNLSQGTFTFHVTDESGTPGVALLEIFELD